MNPALAAVALTGAMLAAALVPPGPAGVRLGLALPLSVVAALWGWPAGVAAGGVWALVFASTEGIKSALVDLAGPLVGGLVCGLGLRSQKRSGPTLLLTAAALAVGLLARLPSLRLAWFQWRQGWAAGVEATLEFYRESGLLAAMAARGVGTEQFRQSLESLAAVMGRLYPTVLAWEIIGGAALVYFASRWAIRRWRPVPPVPAFSLWQLPWPSVWGLIAGLAACLLGDWAESREAVTLGLNLVAVYLPILALYGLAVMTYLYRHMALPAWIKAVGLLPLVLYLPLGVAVLVTVGLFDPWLNFRRLAPQEGGGGR